jgi:hypothetical protein
VACLSAEVLFSVDLPSVPAGVRWVAFTPPG